MLNGTPVDSGVLSYLKTMSKFNAYLYDPSDPGVTAKVQADIPEFKFTCPDIDKLIAYTCFVYDPHADLLKLFPNDFNRRKHEAALIAGFKIGSDGRFDEWAEDCFVGANDDYNEALVAFVTKFNIADLPAFVMYREIFFSEFRAAMKATDSKAKKEAMANAEIARTRVTELEKKIFTDDEVLSVRSALYVMAEKQKLRLRPEYRAEDIETNTLKIKDPYYPKKSTRAEKATKYLNDRKGG